MSNLLNLAKAVGETSVTINYIICAANDAALQLLHLTRARIIR